MSSERDAKVARLIEAARGVFEYSGLRQYIGTILYDRLEEALSALSPGEGKIDPRLPTPTPPRESADIVAERLLDRVWDRFKLDIVDVSHVRQNCYAFARMALAADRAAADARIAELERQVNELEKIRVDCAVEIGNLRLADQPAKAEGVDPELLDVLASAKHWLGAGGIFLLTSTKWDAERAEAGVNLGKFLLNASGIVKRKHAALREVKR